MPPQMDLSGYESDAVRGQLREVSRKPTCLLSLSWYGECREEARVLSALTAAVEGIDQAGSGLCRGTSVKTSKNKSCTGFEVAEM